jgi:hypothetical protein
VLDRLEAEQAIGEVEDAYELHRKVYQNIGLPLATRMRAAQIAIEYERPRLAVTGIFDARGDFAERLERAVERSRAVRVIEHSGDPAQ